MPMAGFGTRLLSRITIGGMLSAMWILRRVDRKFLGSSSRRPDDQFRLDPYTSFRLVQNRGPVLRSYANRGWVVTGYPEVQDALRNPLLSSDLRRNRFFLWLLQAATGDNPVPFIDNPPMLNQDPPNHTRLRKLVSTGFTNRYIQSLTPVIESRIDSLLDDVGSRSQFDVIASLAEPLPAMIIAGMMGVPEDEQRRFISWSHDLIGATVIDRPELVEKAAIAEQEMHGYIAKLIAEKRQRPADDFISRLVAAHQDNDSLTQNEMISTCILLLAAGHETTTRLIGNGLYTLITHPDQFDRLRADRSLLENAIEEMLRYEPPVQITLRFVAEDHEFHGVKFKRGQMVLVNLAAANRDPRVHQQPDEFDITRKPVPHLSFGYGIHLCLGLTLARLEARLAFNALLDRYSRFELVEAAPSWQGNAFFRGMERLWVTASPGS